MTFEVYIMGNSVGRVTLNRTGDSYRDYWSRSARTAVANVNAIESCIGSMIKLLKGGYSYATFGEGIGELKVV